MKKISLVLCLAIIAATALPSNALDIKSGLKSAVGQVAAQGTDEGVAKLKKQIDIVINKSDKITTDFENALNDASNLLGIKNLKEELEAEQKNMSKQKSNQEQGSTQGKNAKDEDADAAAAERESEIVEAMKNLSASKKSEFISCVGNMGVAALGYADVSIEALNLLTIITDDPASAFKLGADLKRIKKVATNAPKQAKLFGNTVKTLCSLASKAGINIKLPQGSQSGKAKNATI